ncbi:MAG: acyloxyacyl hydrolase [Acidobacteriaceae bacterium]
MLLLMRAPAIFTALLWFVASASAGDFTVQTGYAGSDPSGLGYFHVYTSDRRLLQILVGRSWTLHEWRHVRLSYHADLIPVSLLSDPAERLVSQFTEGKTSTTAQDLFRTDYKIGLLQSTVGQSIQTSPSAPPLQINTRVTRARITTFGGGANPVGFELHFRPSRRIQPYAVGTGGFLIFTHEEPVNKTSAFNFSFAFGGGADIRTRDRRVFTVGYKLLHFSNANLGILNPGVNTSFIYIGYRFGK